MRIKAATIEESSHDNNHDPPFTPKELAECARSFNPKKAPGGDGLTSDICGEAIFADPDVFLALANRCLDLGYFPSIWKKATVIVLKKPGKDDYNQPKSYRPIGLLPVLGKIMEKMMVKRLNWHLIPRLSLKQYGFMPQRGTEDALYTLMRKIKLGLSNKKLITLISLDIEGAFDNAWWPAICVRLTEERCPPNLALLVRNYLGDREVRVVYGGAVAARPTNKGCVQGSISGPTLWNLLLDPLLQTLERAGVYAQAFADDVVLLFESNTALETEKLANDALTQICEWGHKNKLRFAPAKTKAMLMTNKLKYDTPRLNMGGTPIHMSNSVKILGLTIDHKITFSDHINAACNKAIGLYKQVSKAARVSWGLSPEIIKIIYTAVVEPIVLYAANAWADAANKAYIIKKLDTVQRSFAIKICRAYRTTPLSSLRVLSGLLPLDLRAHENKTLYEIKKGYTACEHLKGAEVEIKTPFCKTSHPATAALEYVILSNEELTINGSSLQIYTDGSKTEEGVGAAISLWKGDIEIKSQKLHLAHFCTVYQAELMALKRAAQLAVQRKETEVLIYSDSRSALDAVVGGRSFDPLVTEIRELLIQHSEKNIKLFWVKAHAGRRGNERADQLAKEATGAKQKPVYDRCPISYVKKLIRENTVQKWVTKQSNETTGATTRMFLPDPETAYRTVRSKGFNPIMTQILTGHGAFAEYLHRFKIKPSPACECDENALQTVEHLLTECPIFTIQRHNLEQTAGMRIARNVLPDILAGHRLALENFCERILERTRRFNGAQTIDKQNNSKDTTKI
ncbi:unnamed protein product [Pieris macdunnoughi]|nr:unnamed protein product [Pieris macdunnoughi]